jgi:hypothetical protein
VHRSNPELVLLFDSSLGLGLILLMQSDGDDATTVELDSEAEEEVDDVKDARKLSTTPKSLLCCCR